MITCRLRDLSRYPLSLILGGLVTFSVHAEALLHPESGFLSQQIQNHPDSDLVFARIPVREAPIASVALARTEIALHKARQKAGQISCTNRWLPNGPVTDHLRQGVKNDKPVLVRRDKQYWYYLAQRKPRPFTCKNTSRTGYFLEMSRHLPEWIVVRPAGQQFAFQQGIQVTGARTSVVALVR